MTNTGSSTNPEGDEPSDSSPDQAVQARYDDFIRAIVEREEVWGLYCDGWAMAGDSQNKLVFPLWATADLAKGCATGGWGSFDAVAIAIDEFVAELIPSLAADHVQLGLLYTSTDKGIVVAYEKIIWDIKMEIEKQSDKD